MKNIAKKFYNSILDFILPPVCINCENPLTDDKRYLCKKCEDSIEKIDNDSGIVSNRLIRYEGPARKAGSGGSNHVFSHAYSLYLFQENSPIQSLIHAFKYSQIKRIGNYYGSILANEFYVIDITDVEYVIPVPLHISKKRERGYNQSDFICDGISKSLDIPSLKKCLKRTRFTKTQTKLSREERIENVKSAFIVREGYKELVKRKNIIIVDDVITTGSTILECAKVLKEAGCGEITVCSLALAE